jgi:hypothetical protein
LLRPVADGPDLGGTYERRYRRGDVYDWFRYDVLMIEGVSAMIRGIRGIEESSVYQGIFAKGEVRGEARGRVEGQTEGAIEEARKTLLRWGRKKLGPASDEIEIRLTALRDLDQLDVLLDRVLDLSTWDELLASPGPDD